MSIEIDLNKTSEYWIQFHREKDGNYKTYMRSTIEVVLEDKEFSYAKFFTQTGILESVEIFVKAKDKMEALSKGIIMMLEEMGVKLDMENMELKDGIYYEKKKDLRESREIECECCSKTVAILISPDFIISSCICKDCEKLLNDDMNLEVS